MTKQETKRLQWAFSASFNVASGDENLSVESDVLDGSEVIIEPADPKDPESCARIVLILDGKKGDISITTDPQCWKTLVNAIIEELDVVDGIRIRNPNATKEDPCFKCPDKNTERCNTIQCKL